MREVNSPKRKVKNVFNSDTTQKLDTNLPKKVYMYRRRNKEKLYD